MSGIINTNVGKETTLLEIENLLNSILLNTDGVEGRLDTLHADNLIIESYLDGVEGLITTSNIKLDIIHADNLIIESYLDGVEGLITSSNTKLDTLHTDNLIIESYLDGVEGLITSSNTKLDTLHTDNITQNGYLDGLETLITSTNTKLDTLYNLGLTPTSVSLTGGSLAAINTAIVNYFSANPTKIFLNFSHSQNTLGAFSGILIVK